MLIVIATGNQGKVKEFELIAQMALGSKLKAEGIKFITIQELCPDANFDPEETGTNFAENALIKAKAAFETIQDHKDALSLELRALSYFIMSDDSGIDIEAMDGRPGIYAARYLKTNGIAGVLKEVGTNPNRNCKFICHITILDQAGNLVTENESYWHGQIAKEARGTNGFGYDPIVMPAEYPENTVAELSDEIKSKISHRAQAMLAVLEALRTQSTN